MGGAPRSGTSLLQKMIGFHSEVIAGPEFENMYDIVRLYKRMKSTQERGKHELYCNLLDIKKGLREFSIGLLSGKTKGQCVKLICEKTPKNVLVFPELNEIFPDAKFIFVLRDPRSIIASLKKVREGMDGSSVKSAFGKSISSDIGLIRSYIDQGFKFHSKFGEKCHIVQYEKLVQDPETEIGAVCSFLGIDYRPVMLETDNPDLQGQRLKRKMTAWNKGEDKAKKIDASGVNKWKDVLDSYEADLVSLNFANHKYLDQYYDIRFKKSLAFCWNRLIKYKN